MPSRSLGSVQFPRFGAISSNRHKNSVSESLSSYFCCNHPTGRRSLALGGRQRHRVDTMDADHGGGVSLHVTFWLEKDGSICLDVPGAPRPSVRIKNEAMRPSGHPRLYRYLAQYLRDKGAPAPKI